MRVGVAKAKFELPDGTKIEVEGEASEVERLMKIYVGSENSGGKNLRERTPSASNSASKSSGDNSDMNVDINEIVHLIKDCEEAEVIEAKVLDEKSVLHRVLLPLYMAGKYMENPPGLTSGDVSKILNELGVPVKTANASTALSKTAKSYVSGDSVRRRGAPVRYKLIRRGFQYFADEVLEK